MAETRSREVLRDCHRYAYARPTPGATPMVGCSGEALATVAAMSEPLHVTIVYEPGDDGWIVASIPEVPGASSQGRTREDARANVIDALRGILALRFGDHPENGTSVDSEPLELVIGA